MQSSSMKPSSVLAAEYSRELEMEARATRACLQNVPLDKADWKPHEKSMPLGYLALLVADIPKWIQQMIDLGVIDLAAYEHFKANTADELVEHFDKNMEEAKRALQELNDEDLKKTFELKNQGQLLMSSPLHESISSSINHMVHHRGQLTVYLRLNDRIVPSIYGPSADNPAF